MKNGKTLLNDRKTWKTGKRLILKEKIIINMNKILILFEKIKVITQNKKKIVRRWMNWRNEFWELSLKDWDWE